MGPIGLHGGGEFLPGDEPFLDALLEAAREPALERASSCGRAGPDEPIRVVIVPTAAAGQRPDAAVRLGTSAFERVAAARNWPVRVEAALVVDAASAGAPSLAARIAAADVVYLPGGDPAVIPRVLPDTPVLRSILAARARGAVIAGASAGAMALAPRTWTPAGMVPGLALVDGLVVFPHADAATWERRTAGFGPAIEAGLGILGLGERTGVLSAAGTTDWRVIGPGEVRWLPPGAAEPRVAIQGETLVLSGPASGPASDARLAAE